MKTPKDFLGTWRIVETELWDKDALDLVMPAHITFTAEGHGNFQMIAVQGDLDCRFERNRVEFSWIGDDEGDPANGRGWAEIGKDGKLRGRVYLQQGDDSGFVAKRK
jgi:hypothetical protein